MASCDEFFTSEGYWVGSRSISPQLNDDLLMLTSVQMLGKIFVRTVYI